jgi:hypothetical protein
MNEFERSTFQTFVAIRAEAKDRGDDIVFMPLTPAAQSLVQAGLLRRLREDIPHRPPITGP